MHCKYVALRIAHALALGACPALVACGQHLSAEDGPSLDFEQPDAGLVEPVEPAPPPDAGTTHVEPDAGLGMHCIDIASQPAADFLTSAPKSAPVVSLELMPHAGTTVPPLEDADCPEGTTPYYNYGIGAEPARWSAKKGRAHRLRLERLARTKQRDDDEHEHDEPMEQRVGSREAHQYAVAYAWDDTFGVSARLSVWRPELEHDGDFSLAQVWVVGGTDGGYTPEGAETVEAGWQVSRGMYGDGAPRLFGFWTNDGYETGCYNLACAGFVQVSSRFGLGARFTDYNRVDLDRGASAQLMIVKDGAEGDWWLAVEGHWIGYWPRELFTAAGLRERGELLEVGGEVHSEHSEDGHTKTHMGAGLLVRNTRSNPAAWISHIRAVDDEMEPNTPSLMLQVTDRQCYGAALPFKQASRDNPSAPTLLFGGPGYSRYCQ
jgi:hypothetical protein